MKEVYRHTIDFEMVSKGLNLPLDYVINFFDDGRIIGRLGEFISQSKFKTERPSENSSFDVIGELGEKIEVRCVTNNLSFAASNEIGKGRKVTEEGFKEKINGIDVYHVIDKRKIDDLIFIEVNKQDLSKMIDKKYVRKNKQISSKKFFEYYDSVK